MADVDRIQATWAPRFRSIVRIVAAAMLMQHGLQKTFGALGGDQAELSSLIGVAGLLEFFGGLLLFIGLLTRPVAFVLSGLMASAYFMAHAPQGFWPILNKGELAVLYSFIFLYFAAAGAGPWSLDHLLSKKRSSRSASLRRSSSGFGSRRPDPAIT